MELAPFCLFRTLLWPLFRLQNCNEQQLQNDAIRRCAYNCSSVSLPMTSYKQHTGKNMKNEHCFLPVFPYGTMSSPLHCRTDNILAPTNSPPSNQATKTRRRRPINLHLHHRSIEFSNSLCVVCFGAVMLRGREKVEVHTPWSADFDFGKPTHKNTKTLRQRWF